MVINIFHYVDFHHSSYMDLIDSHCGLKMMLLVVMFYVMFRQFRNYDLHYSMVQWFKCSGSIYMTDHSFLNKDYSHISTKYNAKKIEQCYEIYWYIVNRVYILCFWVQADHCASNTKEESEYVNTYCLIILLLFILNIINHTLVLVELYNIYENI